MDVKIEARQNSLCPQVETRTFSNTEPVCFDCQNMDYLKLLCNEHILDLSYVKCFTQRFHQKAKKRLCNKREKMKSLKLYSSSLSGSQSSCHLSSSVWQRVPQKTTSSVGECLHLPESWAQIWHACCELGCVLNYLIWWVLFNIFRLIIYCKSERVQNVFIVKFKLRLSCLASCAEQGKQSQILNLYCHHLMKNHSCSTRHSDLTYH